MNPEQRVTEHASGLVVGVDATNLRQGGGRTHLIELLKAAEPKRDGFDKVVVWGAHDTLVRLSDRPWLRKEAVPALEQGLVRRTLWQRFSLATAARAAGCDVLFVPGGSYSANFHPIVTMSRNMLPFEWAELLRYGVSWLTLKLLMLRHTQSKSFRNADGVIFLTEYAKVGVLRVTGTIKGATRVIPHGLNQRFFIPPRTLREGVGARLDHPIRLLYVSIIDQYKHQWFVVEGVAAARKATGLNLILELVGPAYPPALRRLQHAVHRHDPEGAWVHYKGAVPYEDLHALYAQANIGIFASSCENMPNILLETMAVGLPIACSDRGPMPEILGEAGEYFDPECPASLSAALERLLRSADVRKDKAEAAFQKASAFSWPRCAQQTFGFIAEVARGSAQVGLGPCAE